MKNNKLQNLLYLVIWLLEGAALAFAVTTVWQLDMLPEQYLLLVVALALLVWALSGLALLLPSRKPGGGKIRRGISCVLVLLVVLGCAVLTTVVMDLYETMHQIVDDPTDKTVNRGVYVLADDPAQSLADVKNYTFAKVTGYDEAYTGGAVAVIEKTVGGKLTVREFESIPEMVAALYEGSVDAVILNSASIAIIQENTAYTDFSQQTKLLCQVEVREEDVPATQPTQPTIPSDPTDPSEDVTVDPDPTEPSTQPSIPEVTVPPIAEPKDITNTPFVVYVSGSDNRGTWIEDGRSDVNILVVVNPETKQVLLINTPRDFYIPNPAGNGKLDKLTHCGNDGLENSMKALGDLYNVPVSYYANINFVGFETFIDAIGGVTVYSDYSYRAVDTWIYPGENYLNGKQALDFARERDNVPGGDLTRGVHQMRMIKAVIQKMTSSTALITGYADILESLTGMFRMSISVEEISQLVKMQLGDMASWNISSYATQGKDNGAGVMAYTYSVPGVPLWVLPPDDDSVEHASKLIEMVVSGEILTEEDLVGPIK